MRQNDTETIPDRETYGLTEKQYKFCNEYLKSSDGNAAYRAAYNTNGSDATVSSQVSKLLKNAKVQAYLRDMRRQVYEQARAENKDIMDTIEIMVWWSNIIKSESRSIKIADRIKCSELLAKSHGMFNQKIEADVNHDIVINITGDDEEDVD